MIIEQCDQGSERWDEIRRGIPTASNFKRIVTPARGQLAADHKAYAAELIAESMGVVVPPPPSFWMEWGTENEPLAVLAYEQINDIETTKVGFVWADERKLYGCSPDRFVGDDGLLEIKCPKPETLVQYHITGEFPNEYKPQVQGQLLITGRDWCDFFVYHPEVKPFLIQVNRDEEYIEKMRNALEEFCAYLGQLKVEFSDLGQFISVSRNDVSTVYTSSEIEL